MVRSRREIVTRLAGVASADGPNCSALIVATRTSGSAWLSGPSAPVMRTVWNVPTASSSGTTTMPSISGASRWLRATPGASTSTSTSVPTRSSRRAAVMASWRSRSSASRSSTRAAGHRPVEVGGVGAVLPRVGEEPAPVELGGLDEREQLVVVGLGLARVADDEVRPEGRVGRLRRGSPSMRARNRSPSPQRRMRRTSGADTCWSERSKYGTPVASIASTSRGVSSDGYR